MNVLEYESRVIRDLIALYPGEFEPDRTMFDAWCECNISASGPFNGCYRDPLVALYFAVEDTEHNSKTALLSSKTFREIDLNTTTATL
jgi:hypothetical protein